MKKILCLSIALLLTCVSSISALTWAFFFVVHDGKVYEVIEEITVEKNELGKQIGEVQTKADEYSGDYYGDASNAYDIGTPYFEIQGIPIKDAIAVEIKQNHFVKAEYVHKAQFDIRNVIGKSTMWIILSISFIFVVGMVVFKSKQA